MAPHKWSNPAIWILCVAVLNSPIRAIANETGSDAASIRCISANLESDLRESAQTVPKKIRIHVRGLGRSLTPNEMRAAIDALKAEHPGLDARSLSNLLKRSNSATDGTISSAITPLLSDEERSNKAIRIDVDTLWDSLVGNYKSIPAGLKALYHEDTAQAPPSIDALLEKESKVKPNKIKVLFPHLGRSLSPSEMRAALDALKAEYPDLNGYSLAGILKRSPDQVNKTISSAVRPLLSEEERNNSSIEINAKTLSNSLMYNYYSISRGMRAVYRQEADNLYHPTSAVRVDEPEALPEHAQAPKIIQRNSTREPEEGPPARIYRLDQKDRLSQKVSLADQELAKKRIWFRKTVGYLLTSTNGFEPNYGNLYERTDDPMGREVMAFIKQHYNGSLYQALVDAKIDPQPILERGSKEFVTPYKIPDLAEDLRRLGEGKLRPKWRGLHLESAAASEAPPSQSELRKAVVAQLIQGAAPDSASLAQLCSKELGRRVDAAMVLTQLRALVKSRTVLDDLKVPVPNAGNSEY